MNNIKTIKTLERIIKQKVREALRMTSEDIYFFMKASLQNFYMDYDPLVYIRTYAFLESLFVSNIIVKNNAFHCWIGLKDSYLDSVYKGGATGKEVATWSDDPTYKHTHGYTVGGNVRVFNDAWNAVGGIDGTRALFKKNLKKVGLSVK